VVFLLLLVVVAVPLVVVVTEDANVVALLLLSWLSSAVRSKGGMVFTSGSVCFSIVVVVMVV